jgi:hypothetical protein
MRLSSPHGFRFIALVTRFDRALRRRESRDVPDLLAGPGEYFVGHSHRDLLVVLELLHAANLFCAEYLQTVFGSDFRVSRRGCFRRCPSNATRSQGTFLDSGAGQELAL